MSPTTLNAPLASADRNAPRDLDARHYNGREVTDLLRAIRNVAEHWFQPCTPREEAALESLTGRSAEEIRKGQATEQAANERAEAIEGFFLHDGSFAELLVLFATSNSADDGASEGR